MWQQGKRLWVTLGYWDKDPKKWEKARKDRRKYPKLRVSQFKQ